MLKVKIYSGGLAESNPKFASTKSLGVRNLKKSSLFSVSVSLRHFYGLGPDATTIAFEVDSTCNSR